MTKRRRPGTVEDAIHRIAGELGADAAGALLNKTGALIRRGADPDDDFSLGVDKCMTLDEAYSAATGEPPPILAVYAERLREAASPHEPMAALERIAQASKESGEATAALARIAEGNIGANQYNDALREAVEARDAWSGAVKDLQARFHARAIETGEQ